LLRQELCAIHYVSQQYTEMQQLKTRSPAIARKSRLYRLRPKPRVRLSVTERMRFVIGDRVPCTLC